VPRKSQEAIEEEEIQEEIKNAKLKLRLGL
jgi:hypothetical protein